MQVLARQVLLHHILIQPCHDNRDEDAAEKLLEEVAALDCPVVTVEDAIVDGGLGSAVLEWMSAHGFNRRITRLGLPTDRFVAQGTPAQLRAICGIDSDSIYKALLNSCK